MSHSKRYYPNALSLTVVKRNGKLSDYVDISIGNALAKRLGLKYGDLVDICVSEDETKLSVDKSEDEHGNRIYPSAGSYKTVNGQPINGKCARLLISSKKLAKLVKGHANDGKRLVINNVDVDSIGLIADLDEPMVWKPARDGFTAISR